MEDLNKCDFITIDSKSRLCFEFSCRICLDRGDEDLISACNCSGTAMFTHESCLKKWIEIKYPDVAKSRCEICNEPYHVKANTSLKFNPNYGITQKFGHCCSIPILIFILLALGITIFITGKFKVSFNGSIGTSEIVLIVCSVFSFLIVLLLIRSIYVACFTKQLKNWELLWQSKKSITIKRKYDSDSNF